MKSAPNRLGGRGESAGEAMGSSQSGAATCSTPERQI